MSSELPPIYVIAHNIRSLYNVGSLFRLCEAVAVQRLYLTGLTGTPTDSLKNQRQRQQIAKTALAGLNHVRWEHQADIGRLMAELKGEGIQLVALEQSDQSQVYDQAAFHYPTCLILGHETDGLAAEILTQADLTIEIPMYGHGKSLNVISAASVALYHLRQET